MRWPIPKTDWKRHLWSGSLAWRIAVLFLLLVGVARETVAPVTLPDAASEQQQQPPPLHPTAPIVTGDYKAVTERPLFSPSRRPGKPATTALAIPAAPPVSSSTLSRYVLIGITTAHGQRIALLKPPGGKAISLTSGQTVEGWTLRDIAPGRLHFEAGSDSYEIAFPSGKGTPR